MGKKIALNVFYTLCLVMCFLGMVWAYKNNSYLIVLFFASAFATFLFFKIQLLKDFKKETNNKPKQDK